MLKNLSTIFFYSRQSLGLNRIQLISGLLKGLRMIWGIFREISSGQPRIHKHAIKASLKIIKVEKLEYTTMTIKIVEAGWLRGKRKVSREVSSLMSVSTDMMMNLNLQANSGIRPYKDFVKKVMTIQIHTENSHAAN